MIKKQQLEMDDVLLCGEHDVLGIWYFTSLIAASRYTGAPSQNIQTNESYKGWKFYLVKDCGDIPYHFINPVKASYSDLEKTDRDILDAIKLLRAYKALIDQRKKEAEIFRRKPMTDKEIDEMIKKYYNPDEKEE